MVKLCIRFFALVISLGLIFNLSRSIQTLWQKGNVLGEREAKLRELEQERIELERQLVRVKSPEFIEKEAREKLNLQKPDEVVVVLPKNLVRQEIEKADNPDISNWQKWWKLFF